MIGEIAGISIVRSFIDIGDGFVSEHLSDGFSCFTIDEEGFFFEAAIREEEPVEGYEAYEFVSRFFWG